MLFISSILILLLASNYPTFVRRKIIDKLVFTNESDSMSRFVDTRDLKNLRLAFYVFNVTNPQEAIQSGAKINLQEIGPFVYHEYKYKHFTHNNQTSGLITYKLYHRYILDLEASVGDPNTTIITWPNVPLVAAKTFIDKQSSFIRTAAYMYLNMAIKKHQEGPFLTDSVQNLLFDGSERKLFEDLQKSLPIKIDPWPLKDNKFAMLYDKNDTWNPLKDRELTISTGDGLNQTYRDLNQFTQVNRSSTLMFWEKEPVNCNQVRGTDGQFFSPFMNPSEGLEVYTPDLCRKITFDYNHAYDLRGVPVIKYTFSPKNLQSGLKNLNNLCYCLSRSQNNTPGPECRYDGLIDLSTCISPGIFASGAHFIYGSPELLQQVSGISQPDSTIHQPTLYVEPNFGLTMKSDVPLQFNVKLEKGGLSMFDFLNNSQALILPLLWVSERSEATDDQAAQIKINLVFLDSWLVMMVLGGALLLILIIVVCSITFIFKLRRSTEDIDRETEPLLRE